MQDTAATWLMTALTGSPLLIALMQTAASAPVLLLGVFAGATADIFERRRLLIFWQTWQMLAVALMALLALGGIIGPVALLALTFLMNIGSAMNNPAWQAIVPELVPREELPNAVSLAAASNNLARAVGPALGGLLVAAFVKASTGAGWVFALNAGFIRRSDLGALGMEAQAALQKRPARRTRHGIGRYGMALSTACTRSASGLPAIISVHLFRRCGLVTALADCET